MRRDRATVFVMLASLLAAGAVPAVAQARRPSFEAPPGVPAVDYPHPIIVEVLFDPPSGDAGDASRDGIREPTGDEFIEIINPHQRSIAIGGYTLSDRNHPGSAGFMFRFPNVRLAPGQSAVVFNGLKTRIDGAHGNRGQASAPPKVFHGAYVFHAANGKSTIGLANGGDWVLLSTPRNAPVQCVWWGEFDEGVPRGNRILTEQAPGEPWGSVVRATAVASPGLTRESDDLVWTEHPSGDGIRSSPGQYVPPDERAPANDPEDPDARPIDTPTDTPTAPEDD